MYHLEGTSLPHPETGEICKIVQLIVFQSDDDPENKILLGLDNAGQVWQRMSGKNRKKYEWFWARYLGTYDD